MRYVLGAYYIVLALWAALEVFWLFLGAGADLLGLLLSGLLAILGIASVGVALWRPTARKLGGLGIALLLGVGLVLYRLPQRASISLFFALRGQAMDAFVEQIRRDDRITGMSDGQRHFKDLNGHLVAYTAAEVDPPMADGLRRREPLDSVLRREGIPRELYERYRGTLRDLGLLSFERTDGYVAFVSDGFLDNLYGFVFVPPGQIPPALKGEFVEATQLVTLEPLARGWYFFTTT